MQAVSLSPKFQVVIPRQIRQALNLIAGQQMQVRQVGKQVIFEPEPTIHSYEGRWPGLDTTVIRDPDRV